MPPTSFNKIFKPSGRGSKKSFSRPEGAGNFDNMDDYNIVDSVEINTGTIQGVPTNAKDIVNKEYVDSGAHDISLDEINNPVANVDFNFGNNKTLTFRSVDTTPTAGEGVFNFQAGGAFTGDVVHIHQHTGNPGAGTNLLFLEAEDDDVTPMTVCGCNANPVVLSGAGLHLTSGGQISGGGLVMNDIISGGGLYANDDRTGSLSGGALIVNTIFGTGATAPTVTDYPIGTVYLQYTP